MEEIIVFGKSLGYEDLELEERVKDQVKYEQDRTRQGDEEEERAIFEREQGVGDRNVAHGILKEA